MPDGSSLSISNWNVERPLPSQARLMRISNILESTESDIWFLTETHQDLVPAASFYSVFSGIPDRTFSEGERWVSLWSRWPIQDLNYYVTDKSRCVAGLITDLPFGSLVLYGTVLPWESDRRTKENGNFVAYKEALEMRKHDLEQIMLEFPEAQLVLAGDFNQSLVSANYYGSRNKRIALEAFLKELDLTCLTSAEMDPVFRNSAPNACIDHVCLSSKMADKLKTTSSFPKAENLDNFPSDHYLISVELG